MTASPSKDHGKMFTGRQLILEDMSQYAPKDQSHPVYLARGGGVDTVPAMLTPGEFVMNKGAVGKYGKSFMSSLNKGQIQGFNQGGEVQYLKRGGSTGSPQGGIGGLDEEERKRRLREHYANKKEAQVGPKTDEEREAAKRQRQKTLMMVSKRRKEKAKERQEQKAKFQGFESQAQKEQVTGQRSRQSRIQGGFARRQRSGSRVAQRLNRRATQRGAVTPQMQQQAQQQQQQQQTPMQQVQGGMQQVQGGMQRMAPGGGGMQRMAPGGGGMQRMAPSGGGGGGGGGMQPQGMEQAFQPVVAGLQAAGVSISEQIMNAFAPIQQVLGGFNQSLGQTLAAGNFDTFVKGLGTAAASLDQAAKAFSGMTMTHNINFQSTLELGGIDSEAMAEGIKTALGEYISGIVADKMDGPKSRTGPKAGGTQ